MVFSVRFLCVAVAMSLLGTLPASAQTTASAGVGPARLQVDRLDHPLGIDDPTPVFSWNLNDPARGARQTAYEIDVAASEEKLDKGSLWSSGKIESGKSLNVRYAGPALAPSTRYFWQVKAWGADGKPYPASKPVWWETGLLRQDAWRGEWIGFETAEEAAVRSAGAQWICSPDAHSLAVEKASEERFAYRDTVRLTKSVVRAELFATGQDTVSAWVNGKQVLIADPLPPWKQMPWKKFVRADVTIANRARRERHRHRGSALCRQSQRHGDRRCAADDRNAGRGLRGRHWATFASDTTWKTAVHAAEGWQREEL